MAKDLNKVLIIGRLGTEPDMRQTANGSTVTTFRVSASRQWKDSSGELREEIEWFSVVAWNKLAELCAQHLARNVRVYLEGRLQTRSWEDPQSGTMRYKTEVVASDMIVIEPRGQREPTDTDAEPPLDAAEPPFRPLYRERGATNTEDYPPPEIGDDDVPF